MIKILESLNRIKININPKIYSHDIIEETLEEFRELCEWEIKKNDSEIDLILISKKELDLERLGYEFMNHLFARLKESVA